MFVLILHSQATVGILALLEMEEEVLLDTQKDTLSLILVIQDTGSLGPLT